MGKFIDLTGKKFNELEAIRLVGRNKSKKLIWECLCICGKLSYVNAQQLTSSHTKSCGCLTGKYISDKKKTHGMRKTRIYNIWALMNRRCTSPKSQFYYCYGGRGIRVEWSRFEDFASDMLESYTEHCAEFGTKETTIERIDNDKNYCKANCRWATNKEQARNHRNNRKFMIGGSIKTVAELSEEYNINRGVVSDRINKLKWPIEKALTTPIRKIR